LPRPFLPFRPDRNPSPPERFPTTESKNRVGVLSRVLVASLLLACLLAGFFYDVCFFGKSLSTSSLLPGATPYGPYGFLGHRPELPFSFDTGGNAWVNEPNPYIIRRVLDEGALPAWNPHEGLGIPLAGNLNSEVFNPLKVFLNLFPHPVWQDMFFLLRLFIMGLFTYLFLRERNLSHGSSLFGSSFFMLSGYSVWWINLHPLSTVMYLPAVFYFYERWSGGRDLKSAFLMSLFLCLALVAGKTPDVVMGLCLLFPYALWKGTGKDSLSPSFRKRGISRSMLTEGGRVIMGTVSGVLMASAVLLPFLELYSRASPLAKAIRTGAASHTIPLITSTSLLQPLFLGWKNYYYASWLTWTPHIILPHAGIVVMVLSLYCALNRTTLIRTLPFLLFSLCLFSVVYGLLPAHMISKLPVLGSVEFLKYNAMLSFSLAVMSASAFDDLLSPEGNKKKLYLSLVVVSFALLTFFIALYREGVPQQGGQMIAVLLLSLCGMGAVALVSHRAKRRNAFGILIFLFLILELFLYMPKDHPDRFDPYQEPPYLKVIKEKGLHRITGDGKSVPPLVSNALGLYDIRGISVLLPGDYYLFSENLLGFSVPGTSNPNPLFTATSPFIDLLGVKHVMSREPLEHWILGDEIRAHISSLRWVRLFNGMVSHSIRGGATYGVFQAKDEGRFSFFFPMKFAFETRLKVSEPFLFAGFALKEASRDARAEIEMEVEGRTAKLAIREGEGWKDQWLDVSPHMGKTVTVVIRGEGNGEGRIVLGDFGPSPGKEREQALYGRLLLLHERERDFLEYRGTYEGIHLYENRNVMDRAFVLRTAEVRNSLDAVIKELQQGASFRDVGLITGNTAGASKKMAGLSLKETTRGTIPQRDEKVVIRRYAPDEVAIEVDSGGGLLVLSDLFYPGWKVKVNGREEEVIKAFGLLRGVMVGEGRSEVVFYYRPLSFYLGMIVSLAAIIAWLAYLYVGNYSKKVKVGEESHG